MREKHPQNCAFLKTGATGGRVLISTEREKHDDDSCIRMYDALARVAALVDLEHTVRWIQNSIGGDSYIDASQIPAAGFGWSVTK